MQKEKQLIPLLRFPEFERKWEEKKLGDISKFYKGKGISKKHIDQEGINECIRYGELYTVYNELIGKVVSRTNVALGDSVLSKKDDVIIPSSGETQLDIATASCVLNEGIILGGDLNVIRSKVKGVFLAYLLNNTKKIEIAKLAQGNSVVHLYNKQLASLSINVPSNQEQQKIANFLSSVDTRIQNLEKKKGLLEQYKKGVMQQLFKQEIRFKDDDGNDFPEWEYKNGNVLFKSISDKKHNSDLPILAVTQDQGAIPRHLIDYNIGVTAKSVSSYKVVQVGDFIISLRSFQGGIEYSNYKGICSPAYIILRPIEKMDKAFYKYYLKTPSYIRELTRKLEGIRDGKMVSYKYFSEIKLPYPSFREQTKIANFLSAIDDKIDLVNQQIERSKTYKKGLLQQMFV